jgi:hypothetical protein
MKLSLTNCAVNQKSMKRKMGWSGALSLDGFSLWNEQSYGIKEWMKSDTVRAASEEMADGWWVDSGLQVTWYKVLAIKMTDEYVLTAKWSSQRA